MLCNHEQVILPVAQLFHQGNRENATASGLILDHKQSDLNSDLAKVLTSLILNNTIWKLSKYIQNNKIHLL